MSKFSIAYDNLDAMNEALGNKMLRDLFIVDKDKKTARLDIAQFEGIKTVEDVEKLSEALQKERTEHKNIKAALTPWNALGKTPDEIAEAIEELEELRVRIAAAGDPADLDEKVNMIADSRIKREIAPLQRKLEALNQERDAAVNQVAGLKTTLQRNAIRDTITKAALNAKIEQTAITDAIIIGLAEFEVDEESGAITHKETGLDAEAWLIDQKDKRPHWWPRSVGGGARGGGVSEHGETNPWSPAHWNVTTQGQFIRTHGTEKAERLAKAAGSRIGATRPTPND